jgi:hypothetical protein
MGGFSHGRQLQIINFDPLESGSAAGCETAVAGSARHIASRSFRQAQGLWGKIRRFRGWEHDIGRYKTEDGRRSTRTEEGVDRRG